MANEYLTRTPTSGGNRKVWTWASWFKLNETTPVVRWAWLFNTSVNGGILINYGGTPYDSVISWYDNGAAQSVFSEASFRDINSWYHLVVNYDSTLVEERERVRFYMNGQRLDYTTNSNIIQAFPSQNFEANWNDTIPHSIGRWELAPGRYIKAQYLDQFFIDGQALTPDVFGFHKDGDGYMSSGTTQATDFRPGQWSPRLPKSIKYTINRSGGFGANGFYLPMNDSSNPGADFHCEPNSIIKLKGEDLPQPRNGAPTTTDAFVSQLRPEVSTLGFDGCVKIDADGDYLTVPSSSDFAYGTGDFTWEAFVFTSALSNDGTSANYLFDHGVDDGVIQFYDGLIRYYTTTTGASGNLYTKGGGLKSSTWQHVAVARQSGTTRLFVDGQLRTSQADTHNYSAQAVTIGDYGAHTGANEWDGFISNARIIKGTALYTANFTAPTEPLTNVTNTKLLCCQSSTDATAATVTPGTITAVGGAFATKNELTGSTVLAVPGASTATGANLVTNGYTWTGASGTTPPNNWTTEGSAATYSVNTSGQLVYDRNGDSDTPARLSQDLTTVNGEVYHLMVDLVARTTGGFVLDVGSATNIFASTTDTGIKRYTFTATSATTTIHMRNSSASGTLTIDNVICKQEDAPRDYSADIKGSGTNKTLTANGNAGVGYELGGYYGSATTFDGSGDYIDISESNNEYDLDGDYTIEFWVNFNSINNVNDIIGTANNSVFLGSGRGGWVIGYASFSNIGFRFGYQNNSSWVFEYSTGITAVANQWYHVAITRSGSTQQIIINGVVVRTETQTNTLTSTDNVLRVGGGFGSTSGLLNGQIQDFRIYNGVAKYKGGFDVPKPYTPVGIEAFRTTADTCKNNFATMNPLIGATKRSGGTIVSTIVNHTDGNLTTRNAANAGYAPAMQSHSNFGMKTGKWYWECSNFSTVANEIFGISKGNEQGSPTGNGTGIESLISFNGSNGTIYIAAQNDGDGFVSPATATITNSAGTSMSSTSDVVGFAFDADNSSMTVYLNGTLNNTATNIVPTARSVDKPWRVTKASNSSGVASGMSWNFGQNPSFSGTTTAGTNADDSGKGLFKYAPPSGFLALCEDNLPAPTIADPGKHFKTVLYTGDGNSGRSITGVGFQPDFVWLKCRNVNRVHGLWDSVRGASKYLVSSSPSIEENDTTNGIQSFDGDGFSIGSVGTFNNSTDTYVAWCWKAGGAAVSNTDGSITSQVSVNQDAGFSIVSYTGTGSAGTIGHGLNAAPGFVIVKNRDQTDGWMVWVKGFSSTEFLVLNLNIAKGSNSGYFNGTPTSTVFPASTATNNNGNNDNMIAYCWTEIEGYSKFGSYVGNQSADGPFVYCGFKPAFVLIKDTTLDPSSWILLDSSRDSVNPCTHKLFPSFAGEENVSSPPGADAATNHIDFVSNGFKLRTNNSWSNYPDTYIFAAFAESPFQTANAK